MIAVNPKDGVTNIPQIFPTVIIRQAFFLIWDIVVVIQSFCQETALQNQFRASSYFGKSGINGIFQGDIYLGFLTFLEKSHWAGTVHQ